MKYFLNGFITLCVILLPGFSSALCIKTPKADVRTGPGTSHERIWEVFQYMPFEKVEKAGDWFKIKDVDGDINWIEASKVTTEYKCAVVKKTKVNLRSGPGTKFSKAGKAEKYHSFKIIKLQKKWANVVDEHGDKFWIYRSLIWIN